ncbi:MAG: hypothetical protein LBR81_07545 [Prevotellaceae bacterium]|jgi:hypothetical protein|nr:hypothetical protein [Prevotellaceae bacterium]
MANKNNKKGKCWVKSKYETVGLLNFLCFLPLTLLFTYNQGMMFECNRLIVVICFDIIMLLFLILRMKHYEFYEDLFVKKRLGLGKSKTIYYKDITDFYWHFGFMRTSDVLIIYHLENLMKTKEVVYIKQKKEAVLIKDKLIEQGYSNIIFKNI